MFSTDDTIVAIATPPGRASLGVIRLSGPAALSIASRLLTRRSPLVARQATLSRIRDLSPSASASHAPSTPASAAISSSAGSAASAQIDQVVATSFPEPHSYTGEDVVELAAHGSPLLLQQIVASAVQAGARLAAPGEFTLRAFLNGRLDLVQAEAVADLIEAVTPAQARQAFDQLEGTLTRAMARISEALFDLIVRLEASLDFPDEGYHFILPDQVGATLASVQADVDALLATARQGRVIREGRQVAIIGGVNVGKSSLFNAFVGTDRAIVTDIAGTTRDLLTERCDIGGIPVTLVDTAGIRETQEVVEREGVQRARGAAETADLSLVVVDRSRPLSDEDRAFIAAAGNRRLLVINKVDLPSAWNGAGPVGGAGAAAIEISVETGAGIDRLREAIAAQLIGDERLRDTPGLSNVRHIELLTRARAAISRAQSAAMDGAPEEFVVADIREAIDAFEEITGKRSSEDVLQAIFGRFCIGK
jgi:tRNA modification GTPase